MKVFGELFDEHNRAVVEETCLVASVVIPKHRKRL